MACPFDLIDESSNDLGVSSDFFGSGVSVDSSLKLVCARIPNAECIGSRYVVVSSCVEGSNVDIPSVSDNLSLKQVCARMPNAKYIGSRFVVVSSCVEGSNGDISSMFITVISISMMSSCVKGSIGVISSIFITISMVGMIGMASLFVPDKVAPSGHR